MTFPLIELRGRLAVLLLVLAGLLPLAAAAAPYAITYTGTIADSGFPELNDGEPFTVTLVFDNGGNTAVNQGWIHSHLTCAIWRMNTAGDVAFAHDLAANPAGGIGAVTTDAGGSLSSNFVALAGTPAPGSYTTFGISFVDPVLWYADGANPIFQDAVSSFGDASGSIQMAIQYWTDPQPFSGSCIATAAAADVPTLGGWSLPLLSSLLALFAIAARRRGVTGLRTIG